MININWGTKVITIPQTDLTHVAGTLYELNTDTLRLSLKSLEDSEAGMPFPDTHRHNTEVTVAGTTFARAIEIINGYSITFSPDALYSVRLVGSNNNFFDVENGILNQNGVQVIPGNAAGLIVKSIGSGLSAEEQGQLQDVHDEAMGKWILDHALHVLSLYRQNGSLLKAFNLTSTADNVPSYIQRVPK